MKTHFRIRILAACSGILLTICVTLIVLAWQYGEPKPRRPSLDMHELMVPISSFPPGWEIRYGDPYPIPSQALLEDYHAEEGYIRTLVLQSAKPQIAALAEHKLFRYRNEWQAAEAFVLDRPVAFYAFFAGATPWKAPEGWSYYSSVAKRFRLACAEFKSSGEYKLNCAAMAQYSEYVSVFSTDVLPNSMTVEDVKRILRTIDDRFATYLTLH